MAVRIGSLKSGTNSTRESSARAAQIQREREATQARHPMRHASSALGQAAKGSGEKTKTRSN